MFSHKKEKKFTFAKNSTMNYIEKYRPLIIALCQQHKVKQLFVFGSVLTDRFNPDSDIDLEVYFENVPHEDYVDNYFNFQDALQELFGREVDLLEGNAIQNYILKNNIDRNKQLIYGWICKKTSFGCAKRM